MSKCTTVLQSLTSHISRYDFQKIVNRFDGDKKIRSLTTMNLFLGLTYAQITKSFSLAELQASLTAQSAKLYHSGLKPIKKSTFADALAKRDPKIFESIFLKLLDNAHHLYDGPKRYRSPLKIIDATTIDLCLSKFNWAKFRTTKGAIKLHACFDPDSQLPNQVFMTEGNVHENNTLLAFAHDARDILVFDRGYNNYKSFYKLTLAGTTFVTRVKQNAKMKMKYELPTPPDSTVTSDRIGTFTGFKAFKDYPTVIRVITYKDPETTKIYRFLTNNFEINAVEIANIYKQRWQIELFFKWIKQNLKIKTFFGTSRNAVWTQIWVALIVHLLVWLTKALEGIQASPQRIMQVLKGTLFERKSIHELFISQIPDHPPDSGLSLFQGVL